MIVVTGARGFIGSNLLKKLNSEGHQNLILVDELKNQAKDGNLDDVKYEHLMDRNLFLDWLEENGASVDFVYHLGARTDTTETSKEIFDKLNLNYSKQVWNICTQYQIPIVYASSAATYGNGELGYNDTTSIANLSPLNPYGWSKQSFDLWAEKQEDKPPFWAGLKFFNVYGPNENHKGRMASVIWHAYHQIKETKALKLFQSHHPNYENGGQLRDFVYVKDVIEVCYFFQANQTTSGIFNLGTGKARTFNDLGSAVFKALDLNTNISYIPTPLDIRDKYQYYTQATLNKLRKAGYKRAFSTLEEGIQDYIEILQNQF